MANYSVPKTIISASREELIEIFHWVQAREKDNPITVLVGGWAVYCYNPWYGSVDIDLVTNNKTRQRLMKYLRDERGFVPQRDAMAPTTVVKTIREGKILIDFGSREDICNFEGRDEQCPFSLLDGRTTTRKVSPGFFVTVPDRTLLMIFKLKATWDRSFRIQNKTSSDEEWERGKLCKDRADILALLDRKAGGTETDISYLGERLNEYSFLKEMLREIPYDSDAIKMYRRMNQKEALEHIERLLLLAR
ncbi:MAG: hypothetical protein PHS80_07670 [Methanothrix sp.]|nr:hypothetical protein [Methanothrix sp.]MDD4446288.1 hypothetical protein [Methanothrix sp.]